MALEDSNESFKTGSESNFLRGYSEKGGDLLVQLSIDVGQKLFGRDRVLCIASGTGHAAGDSGPLHRRVVVTLTRLESVAHPFSGLRLKLEGVHDVETGATLGHFLVDFQAFPFLAGVQTICLVAVLLERGDVVEAESLEMTREVFRDACADGVKVTEAEDSEILGKIVSQLKHLR